MQKNKPTYFIRFEKEYENYPDAQKVLKGNQIILSNIEIGYYIPQPQYKSWVPNWLIRLITKNK